MINFLYNFNSIIIIFIHDFLIFNIINIFFIVFIIIVFLFLKNFNKRKNNNNKLEFLIFLIRTFIIFILIYPILIFIFFINEERLKENHSRIQIISSQWYWNFNNQIIDKYLSFEELLNKFNKFYSYYNNFNYFFNIENNYTNIILNNYINIYLRRTDVEHSIFINNLILKIDSHPGKIMELVFFFNFIGLIKGFCTELCGEGHSKILITFEIHPKF